MTRKTMKNNLRGILLILILPIQLLATEGNQPKSTENSFPDDGIFTGTKNNNLIANPGFENKTSNWTLGKHNGGVGLFTTDTSSTMSEERSALLITDNQNGDYNDLQLFTFIPLTSLTRYSISFQASVKSACLISISISNGFDTFFEEKFLLRPDTKYYGPFLFASKNDDPFVFFSINLGKTNTRILLDDVEIQTDQTEREFEHILSNSGINVYQHQTATESSIYINTPTVAINEIPILLYDEDNRIILSSRILKGESEATISLISLSNCKNCLLKVFTPERQEIFKIKFNQDMDKTLTSAQKTNTRSVGFPLPK